MQLNVVDLFAGCGGLGLGLEQAGYQTVFVNELHPDAMASYLLNRQHEGLHRRENSVNDILSLTQKPGELEAMAARLRAEHGEIALVTGGPPCQGFSGIGHRRSFELTKHDIPSNHLYREMAKVVQAIAPRGFIFENVRGLLAARWSPGGEKGEIWRAVQQTFREIEVKVPGGSAHYVVRPALVQAKEYGVPQNRPRIIMVGVRSDIPVTIDESRRGGGLIPEPFGIPAPDPEELWSDLSDPAWTPGGSMDRYRVDPESAIQKELRTRPDGGVMTAGYVVTEQDYNRHSERVVAKFRHMLINGGEVPEEMRTKKFAQRVIPRRWGPAGPHITATSLADDYVHYELPRVPTVREWARLQTFPDWYQFAGKRTTGGRRRAGDPSTGDWTRELPKYTQIGNAVPVGLGRALGEHLKNLIA